MLPRTPHRLQLLFRALKMQILASIVPSHDKNIGCSISSSRHVPWHIRSVTVEFANPKLGPWPQSVNQYLPPAQQRAVYTANTALSADSVEGAECCYALAFSQQQMEPVTFCFYKWLFYKIVKALYLLALNKPQKNKVSKDCHCNRWYYTTNSWFIKYCLLDLKVPRLPKEHSCAAKEGTKNTCRHSVNAGRSWHSAWLDAQIEKA